jgi:hypothetical protein
MLLKSSAMLTIGLAWVAYAFVFLITLYKSFDFFKQIEPLEEFKEVRAVAPLKNLYLASFILQVIALATTFFLLMFLSK